MLSSALKASAPLLIHREDPYNLRTSTLKDLNYFPKHNARSRPASGASAGEPSAMAILGTFATRSTLIHKRILVLLAILFFTVLVLPVAAIQPTTTTLSVSPAS